MASRPALVTQNDLRRAARVALAEGVKVTIVTVNGTRIEVERETDPTLKPKRDPWDDD